MNYFVYILESLVDGTYYIGYSENPIVRLQDHNGGRARYTSRKRPWKMVYTEQYSTKVEAIRRERFLKKQRNRGFLQLLTKGLG